jgi:hypothetical protein
MSEKQNTTITRINQTFDYNTKLIDEIKNCSIDAAVVFTVSLMETILCEYFYFSENRWFDHCRKVGEIPIPILDTPQARFQIRKYLKNNRWVDEFFELRYIYDKTSNPDLAALHELLAKKINFQSLNPGDNRSGVKAYKIFLNIDLDLCLDLNKEKSSENWIILKKMIQARHEIIHRGKKSDISLQEMESILNSLKYLKKILSDRLCVKYTNP